MKKTFIGICAGLALIFASCSTSPNDESGSGDDSSTKNVSFKVEEVEGKPGLTITLENDIGEVEGLQYLIEPEAADEVSCCHYYSASAKIPTSYYYPFVEPGNNYTVMIFTRKNGTDKPSSKYKITPETGSGAIKFDETMTPTYNTSTNVFECNTPDYGTTVPKTGRFYANYAVGTSWDDVKYLIGGDYLQANNGKITLDFNKIPYSENKEKMKNEKCFVDLLYIFDMDGYSYSFTSVSNRFYTFTPTKNPSSLESTYLKAKPVANGIEVTITLSEGEKCISETWGELKETSTSFRTDINTTATDYTSEHIGEQLNNKGSYTVLFPFTEKNKSYIFELSGQYKKTTDSKEGHYVYDIVKCEATSDGIYKGISPKKYNASKTSLAYNKNTKKYVIKSDYIRSSFISDICSENNIERAGIEFMLVYGDIPWNNTAWMEGITLNGDSFFNAYHCTYTYNDPQTDESKELQKKYKYATTRGVLTFQDGYRKWISADNVSNTASFNAEVKTYDIVGTWKGSTTSTYEGKNYKMETIMVIKSDNTFEETLIYSSNGVEYDRDTDTGTYEHDTDTQIITMHYNETISNTYLTYSIIDDNTITVSFVEQESEEYSPVTLKRS